MGLDISVYGQVNFVPTVTDQDTADREGLRWLYPDPHHLDVADGLAEGAYHVLEPDVELDFRAGSYSGYNTWRAVLSVAGCGATDREVWNDRASLNGKPFVELVDFSDCEGVIGPVTSRKLAKDFAVHRPTREAVSDAMSTPSRVCDGEAVDWWFTKYEQWHAAFQYAGENNGAVVFH